MFINWKAGTAPESTQTFQGHQLPMRRYVAKPRNTRGFEVDVRVKAAGDSMVDSGPSLFLEQADEPLLGADVAVNKPVGMVEVADDGGLLCEGRENRGLIANIPYTHCIVSRSGGDQSQPISKYFKLVISKFGLQEFPVWRNGAKSTANAVCLIGDVETPNRCANGKQYCSNRAFLLRSVAKLGGARVSFSKLCAALQEWQANGFVAASLSRWRLPHHQCYDVLQPPYLPMRRHFPKPLHAGGLVGGVGLQIGDRPRRHPASVPSFSMARYRP